LAGVDATQRVLVDAVNIALCEKSLGALQAHCPGNTARFKMCQMRVGKSLRRIAVTLKETQDHLAVLLG